MAVTLPTKNQLREISEEIGLDIKADEVAEYLELMEPAIESYNYIDKIPDNIPSVKYPRTPGYKPRDDENKFNAWSVKTTVVGNSRGKLKGKRVVLKDNVMLAGVPFMNGSATLEGYHPEIDATVVTRLLDAGATIVGKAHCENFCFSCGSHTNSTGPCHNPYKMGYMAGGSSSGSAVLVSVGEADMAIGGDQGGSIRMPASWCGIYGMKPTHGLVPYTGIMPIEITVDHTGPMTNNVEDNAQMLEVIAGLDGLDPRQVSIKTHKYTDFLKGKEGINNLKIAVVKEGFQQEGFEKDVNEKVNTALKKMQSMGAIVEQVTIPMHLEAPKILSPIYFEGGTQTMMQGDGYGVSRPDLYVTSLMDFHRNWRTRANELPETVKLVTLLGTYIKKYYGSRYYGKATNLTRLLRGAYDKVLSKYDLLAMPTTAAKAQKLPKTDASVKEVVQSALPLYLNGNTQPFNATHHPAMAIPCGMSDGLPVSIMLIGKHFDEPTIYQAAHAFQESTNWKKI